MCRLYDLDKTVHTVWLEADATRAVSKPERQKRANSSRGARDTWDELATGGPMRTLMMVTAVVYAVGSYSFGGATMAQGRSAGAAKNGVLVHGTFGDASRSS